MDNIDDPFRKLDDVIEQIKIENGEHTIIVDVHGESTSEKMAIGHYLDGKVTAILGTHTHVPTADLQILEKNSKILKFGVAFDEQEIKKVQTMNFDKKMDLILTPTKIII